MTGKEITALVRPLVPCGVRFPARLRDGDGSCAAYLYALRCIWLRELYPVAFEQRYYDALQEMYTVCSAAHIGVHVTGDTVYAVHDLSVTAPMHVLCTRATGQRWRVCDAWPELQENDMTTTTNRKYLPVPVQCGAGWRAEQARHERKQERKRLAAMPWHKRLAEYVRRFTAC